MKLLRRSRPGGVSSRVQRLEPGISLAAVLPTAIDYSVVDVLDWAPAHLLPAERLMLFALVCALRPANYLEIGTLQGGSALIVAAAMDASENPGRMSCVDPKPMIAPEHWERIKGRATLIEGYSPSVLAEARERAERPFDFVFIDGDHTAHGVYRDTLGVLPFVSNGAWLAFHDSHFPDVADGINRSVSAEPEMLLDMGTVTREASRGADDESVHWGGLRLLRVLR